MEFVQINFENLNKITIIIVPIFLQFSVIIFPSWIRIQEGKLMRIHAGPDPQPWCWDMFSRQVWNSVVEMRLPD